MTGLPVGIIRTVLRISVIDKRYMLSDFAHGIRYGLGYQVIEILKVPALQSLCQGTFHLLPGSAPITIVAHFIQPLSAVSLVLVWVTGTASKGL